MGKFRSMTLTRAACTTHDDLKKKFDVFMWPQNSSTADLNCLLLPVSIEEITTKEILIEVQDGTARMTRKQKQKRSTCSNECQQPAANGMTRVLDR